ncbi:hypothetical protein D3C86_2205980 [compost metagenome]
MVTAKCRFEHIHPGHVGNKHRSRSRHRVHQIKYFQGDMGENNDQAHCDRRQLRQDDLEENLAFLGAVDSGRFA